MSHDSWICGWIRFPEFPGLTLEIPRIVLEASRMIQPGLVHGVSMLLYIFGAKTWVLFGLFMFRCSTLTAHVAWMAFQDVTCSQQQSFDHFFSGSLRFIRPFAMSCLCNLHLMSYHVISCHIISCHMKHVHLSSCINILVAILSTSICTTTLQTWSFP